MRVPSKRFELPTSGSVDRRSIHLSYEGVLHSVWSVVILDEPDQEPRGFEPLNLPPLKRTL